MLLKSFDPINTFVCILKLWRYSIIMEVLGKQMRGWLLKMGEVWTWYLPKMQLQTWEGAASCISCPFTKALGDQVHVWLSKALAYFKIFGYVRVFVLLANSIRSTESFILWNCESWFLQYSFLLSKTYTRMTALYGSNQLPMFACCIMADGASY